MKRLVAVPVYNEEKTLRGVLESIRKFHKGCLLVINDGSTDASAEVIRSFTDVICISHISRAHNAGYGQSMIDAFRYALDEGYDELVTIDCDDQHEPRHIPALFDSIAGVDVCSCSRYLRESAEDDTPPPDRMAINLKLTGIINRVTGYGLTDSFCGMKGYRVAALKPLNLTETGYAFPLQFWIQAFHFGLTVREFPIARIYKNHSRTFGEKLDNADARLAYYYSVLEKEMKRWSMSLPLELIPTT
ncbi:MAG: glycosyltransferase family 2 protein [Nitrospinae bacterium]|nr:glycosyltransferase family 2 protein [Nitrospinota bacterium]